MARTSVYIDGFNLYYGALKRNPALKWLDLREMVVQTVAPHHDIREVHYFTAWIKPPPHDPAMERRQSAYIRALEAHVSGFVPHFGQFMTHAVKMRLAADPTKRVEVLKTEEKGSDVNLAVHLVNDGWQDKYDCAIVVSNDSDLVEAVRIVVNDIGKKVGVLTPRPKGSVELRSLATFSRHIKKRYLKVSQLPDHIPGTRISRPSTWR